MKKIFTLISAMMLFVAMGADAQVRKTWDFTKGFSDETIANLNADVNNWKASTTTAEGEVVAWCENKKLSGEYKANGQLIQELVGITLGTAGLSSNNNTIINQQYKRVRMNRANSVWNLPKLVNGQKVTLVAQSANATATNRGFKGNGNMTYKSGPENGICLGSSLEGGGMQTLVWEVTTSETDSVEVSITLQGGGCDIYTIMIDEGDQPKSANVLYLGANDANPVIEALNNREFTTVTYAETATAEELQAADMVVVGPDFDAQSEAAKVLVDRMAFQPVLNLNRAIATQLDGVEAYESEAGGAELATVKVQDKKLFANVELVETEAADGSENYVKTFSVTNGEVLAKGVTLSGKHAADVKYAVNYEDEAEVLIYSHNVNRNAYMYLPYSDGAIADVAEQAVNVISNAIDMVADSKAEVTYTKAPTFGIEYGNLETTVTLACANKGAEIHYTLDNTEPTLDSPLYTEPLVINKPNTTIFAVALAEGYLLSEVSEYEVELFQQAKAPSISVAINEKSEAVISFASDEDVDIWYNFTASNDTVYSSHYADTVQVVMAEGATVTAFAIGKDNALVKSVVAQQSFETGIVLGDVITAFDSNNLSADGSAYSNGAGIFSWGKNAEDPYDYDAEPIGQNEEGENIYPVREASIVTNETNDWQIKSSGEAVLWQNNGPTQQVGDGAAYNPERAEDVDISGKNFVTKNNIQFSKVSGQHTASVETKQKVAGPFAVVTYGVCNAAGSGKNYEVQISKDGQAWETLGDRAYVPGTARLYNKSYRYYNETDEAYVRIVPNSTGFGIFNINVVSAQYTDIPTGITELAQPVAPSRSGIFSLSGQKLSAASKGIMIMNGKKFVK